ncbi:putative disease resistance RPP13-like protein 3 [Brachypodium distachyon]|uniref:AAA+ ATPase domain-containing protein n=1 Tax=Brachypodium distachyon TaxID=15368 RepID=A0A0Q3J0Q6_BRADI|nr:putative disease resistance RPP13-like protein 3 [Brachypodium distachyon]XP_010238636.1 putative disease resistance RPP13-like protein 3 [Brachypodium distachyon]XP_024310264.1 putative disease resistance RPP13-like protein 3 [Brachypodium distachyon]KQJ91920.1 hypothetical protein BRADI_4g40583v3 [Brachypodium distachyon]KQJ91921.1 hypothetical protein BRADI_4g40583v3 [Brachypodium distachyon]PNT65330.1 hypothetical protein BRADI_4g40583v3 [Brachypodium distachyon]PNT65331.1 hypothetical|eukprot:XP_010238635.1 putative disease resistance RPP13-like protein 3 [Brachypodium distachyon]
MVVSTMASASTGVMNSLLAKLATLMGEEYRKIKGVRNKVASLQGELNSMNALLVKLAGMDELDVQAKEWRDQVREMTYDIEDCIDDFMRDLAEKGTGTGFLKKTGERLKKLKVRYQIANKIQEIETRVNGVHERRMRYKIDEYTPSSTIVPVDPRVVAMYADAAGLVGIHAPRDELVKLLTGEEKELRVASVVGFGGLGKTTLANEVYRKLQGKFDCQAFVSVSQNPDMSSLLSNLLSKLGGQQSSQTGKLNDLIDSIRTHLMNKRYFIIIDDLWDSSAWNIIRCAFPQNIGGSRVLTTTRIHSVALACCSNRKEYIYKIKSLDEEDSRRLFFSRIFGPGENCPVEFEEVSADILKRCGGLPLAIISISSLLAGQSKPMWEYVRNSLGSMFEGNPTLDEMKQILDLSYRNLPRHLKTCLLYLGIYPEDHEIMKNDLSRQWIAEGFVSTVHGLDAEDVAGSYFNELINRSMIQPVIKNYNDEVLSCRVHDIMLDLIRSKSAEENFIAVIDDPQLVTGGHKKIRRVSLYYDGEEHVMIPATTIESLSQVRTVAVFGSIFSPSFLKLRYTRVLHLVCSESQGLDLTGLCGLVMLRYLKVKCKLFFKVKLPTQIGKLQQLETIDVEGAWIVNIPSDIVRLPQLSHLTVGKDTLLPDGIGQLKCLRTLGWFDLIRNSVGNIEFLGELTNLTKLRIIFDWKIGSPDNATLARRLEALGSSLGRLSQSSNSFKSLVLEMKYPSWLPLHGWITLSPSPRHLRVLSLDGLWFSRIPKWIAELRDLKALVLMITELVCNDDAGVDILARLPSLVLLKLCIRDYPQERVVISGSVAKFQALEYLVFQCPKLFMSFEVGALPRLQSLYLRFNLDGLPPLATSIWEQDGGMRLPVGIEHLPAGLRQVNFEKNGLQQ